MSGNQKGVIQYAPLCTRGEIIACLYNHAVRISGGTEITTEDAERLVHKELGDALTLGGKIVPAQEGIIGTINGVALNIVCYNGIVDVSGYSYGNGVRLINELIAKRQLEVARFNAQSIKWRPLED